MPAPMAGKPLLVFDALLRYHARPQGRGLPAMGAGMVAKQGVENKKGYRETTTLAV